MRPGVRGCPPEQSRRPATGRPYASNMLTGSRMRRMVAGWIVTLAGLALATAGLLPFRADITVATAALVLVVPVALGVAVGGFPAVPFGVAAGFLTFDLVLIPPC